MNLPPATLLDLTTVTELRQLMPGSFARLVGFFVEDAQAQVAVLATTLQTPAPDCAAAGSLAHKLKSGARQLGAVALGETAAALEHACRSTPPQPLTALQQLQQQLQNQLAPTCAALQQQVVLTTNPPLAST